MDEKILIKSERYNVKKIPIILAIIGLVVSLLLTLILYASCEGDYTWRYKEQFKALAIYNEHQEQGYCSFYSQDLLCGICKYGEPEIPSKASFAFSAYFEWFHYLIFVAPFAVFSLIGWLIYLWLRSYELVVTDKRIYGNVAWGKRVDLPVDSISATATSRSLKGVTISTSSGRISFRVIKNADAIYQVVSNLLIERQQEKSKPAPITEAPKINEADQLKKYKELLDMGAITQEEFDAKKKQLLGL